MNAWVDESILLSRVPTPMYLLGASIIEAASEPATARALEKLAPVGRKLHWRELGDSGRAEVLAFVSALPMEHLVVIAAPLRAAMKQERARGLCLERLLWELAGLGVSRVTCESRSAAQDRVDRRRIDGLRSRRLIPDSLRVDWVRGAEQPLLWAPDVVLGAVGEAFARGSGVREDLGARITQIRIDL